MKYRNDLKIEFRGVHYKDSYYILECRISPDQNLEYKSEASFFGWHPKDYYDTKWEQPEKLEYSEFFGEFTYTNFFMKDRSELKEFQEKYKTCGEFWNMVHKINEEERKKVKERYPIWK